MTKYKSKVEIVYETLMNDIAKGVYQPGDRLVISQISKQLNISDIPVREAIRNLESEGYVNIIANQGAVVSRFDKDVISEITQVKAVLEGFASRLSIDYITPRTIKKIRLLNQQMKQAFEENNLNKYSQLNMQFHLEIYNCIPTKELYKMICDLWKKWGITKTVFEIAPESARQSIEEHEEIIRMLEEKNYDEIELFVRNHKFRAGASLTTHLPK